MVGYRNGQTHLMMLYKGVYQAFRWWGIGTAVLPAVATQKSLSGIPMVGYRNQRSNLHTAQFEFIRHSDGGVSELTRARARLPRRVYQAFRWWGIGTIFEISHSLTMSLSGIPMVGYRNQVHLLPHAAWEFIRHSDGGVSELKLERLDDYEGVYQAFRWWGIGTIAVGLRPLWRSLSGIPMVGYRNLIVVLKPSGNRVYQAFRWWGIGTLLPVWMRSAPEFIRHSDGGVSELSGLYFGCS